MEESYREAFDKVSRSVVVVENRVTERYCIGSVVGAEDTKSTFILTSSSFVSICNKIFVHIDDSTVVEAKKVATRDMFILLAIDYRASCTAVKFSNQDVDGPTEAIVLAPTSMSSFSHIPAFVIQASCASRDQKMNAIEDSEKYFLVTCHFGGSMRSGINKLMSAPVFNLNGEAIGLVTSQCGNEKSRVDIKVALLASIVKVTLTGLHEERKKQELAAQSLEEIKHEKIDGTKSSAGTSKRRRKLRKLG